MHTPVRQTVAVDERRDLLYVADLALRTVSVRKGSDGSVLRTWGSRAVQPGERELRRAHLMLQEGDMVEPVCIVVAEKSGNVVVLDRSRRCVIEFDAHGRCVREYPTQYRTAGGSHASLDTPTCLAVAYGQLYVADFGQHFVHAIELAACPL
jgi:hypothetical protein